MGNTFLTEELTKPPITEEEDKPFPSASGSGLVSPDTPIVMQLKDQEHTHSVEDFKNETGKHILYCCLGAVAVAALADSIWHIESELLAEAVDWAKMIATTILGYFFGSRSKSS